MTYGYSDDLRRQALKYYDTGHSQVATCEVFGMSRSTLNNWLAQRRGGQTTRRPQGKPQPMYRIDAQRLRAVVAARPDSYLHEIAAELRVSPSGVYRACRRLDISRKKNRSVSGEG